MTITDNSQTLVNALAEIKRLEGEVQRQREQHRTTWTQLERVAGLLMSEFPLLDDNGLDENEHHCEWAIQQDRKRLHALLADPSQQAAPVQPAPAQDEWDLGLERQAFEAHMRLGGYSNPEKHPDGSYVSSAMELWWQGWKARATRPAQTEQRPVEGIHRNPYPVKCPVTGLPYFMHLEHPELGVIPTFGGPYDSYSIPRAEGSPDEPWHKRELVSHRYCHDRGHWVDDEFIPLRIIHEDVLSELQDAVAPIAQTAPLCDHRFMYFGDQKKRRCADCCVVEGSAQTAPQQEQSGLVAALEYYANGDHLLLADPDEWDTCSGEPANFLHDEAGTASVEDGSIAKVALEAYRATLSAQGGDA